MAGCCEGLLRQLTRTGQRSEGCAEHSLTISVVEPSLFRRVAAPAGHNPAYELILTIL